MIFSWDCLLAIISTFRSASKPFLSKRIYAYMDVLRIKSLIKGARPQQARLFFFAINRGDLRPLSLAARTAMHLEPFHCSAFGSVEIDLLQTIWEFVGTYTVQTGGSRWYNRKDTCQNGDFFPKFGFWLFFTNRTWSDARKTGVSRNDHL